MVRQRIFGILADSEDQNDHDTLRSDPVFKLIADRLPDGPDLACQPTRSRFENAVTPKDLLRERDVLVDLFIQSHDRPPTHLTCDIDACDDPAHGQQQLTMFHGYDERRQYLPIAITLYLHTAALNLLVRLRRAVRQSVATPPSQRMPPVWRRRPPTSRLASGPSTAVASEILWAAVSRAPGAAG